MITQKDLVLNFVEKHGFIIPAHHANGFYDGYHFGSELPRTCRKLREEGKLNSRPDEATGHERFFTEETNQLNLLP